RRVLFGDDVLAEINPSVEAVRHQCEQQARAKLRNLNEVALKTALKPRYLRQAMVTSVPSFLKIGRHLLGLLEQPERLRAKELIAELRRVTQLPLEGLEMAWDIKTGERIPARKEITP
ncbi:MAG: hypothetical protein GTO62_05165, partial [Planctomycetales bacterium]|nr:hypothetical protein [Planctomycetales bacterium]NIP68641.1 hypothetical protein [Planctomycetales bacterium]